MTAYVNCVILYDVMFYCFEILLVYNIVRVMLCKLYVKIKDINGYCDQHQNVHSNLTTMMKHVDFTVNLFHDNFDC